MNERNIHRQPAGYKSGSENIHFCGDSTEFTLGDY